jgi:hypothetical protein
MRLPAVILLSCLLLVGTPAAGSRRCGDDVGGRAVPCDCGDLLVGSRTLGPDDPLTQRVCEGTGLLVDVAPERPAPTLALGGHVLTGSGRGVGIHVVGGGAGGLTIVGPGSVTGFDQGILAANGSLAALEQVTAADNQHDGITIAGSGYRVQACEAVRNGGDGFVLRGSGQRVDGNRAFVNRRNGFVVTGREAVVGEALGNEASGNGREGFVVRGRDHTLAHPVALSNSGDGIHARGAGGRVTGAHAASNRRRGVRAAGADIVVGDSEGSGNGAADLTVRGARSRTCRGKVCR